MRRGVGDGTNDLKRIAADPAQIWSQPQMSWRSASPRKRPCQCGLANGSLQLPRQALRLPYTVPRCYCVGASAI